MSGTTTLLVRKLIERLHRGEESARSELVACVLKRLERLARRMFRNFDRLRRWETASDVVQNAAIRLLRALEQVTPATPCDFFRFAAAQIRRELLDLARHYYGPQGIGTHHQRLRAQDFAARAAPEGEAAELAEWTEFHLRVDALPEEERAVFDLVWYQELSHADAARLLDTSVWTVRRHYRKAKLRLHEWLSRGEDRPGPFPADSGEES